MNEIKSTPRQVQHTSYAQNTQLDIAGAMDTHADGPDLCVICGRDAQLVCPCLQRHFCSTKCQETDWVDYNHHALCQYDPVSDAGLPTHSKLQDVELDADRMQSSRRNGDAIHKTRYDIDGVSAHSRYGHVAHPYSRSKRLAPGGRPVQPRGLGLEVADPDLNEMGSLRSKSYGHPSVELSRYDSTGEQRYHQLGSSLSQDSQLRRVSNMGSTHSQGSQNRRLDVRNSVSSLSITPQLSFNSQVSAGAAHRNNMRTPNPNARSLQEGQFIRDDTYVPKYNIHNSSNQNQLSNFERPNRPGVKDDAKFYNMNNAILGGSTMRNQQSASTDKPFICPWEACKKEFSQANNLKRHIRVHTGEKPYVCTWKDCGKKFGESSNLKRHLRLHSGEKPYPCDWEGCEMSFADASYLKSHQRVHVTNGVFPCTWEGCVKTFSAPAYLKRHIRVHTNEQPYACSYCDKRFNQASNLSRHVRRHTSQRNGK